MIRCAIGARLAGEPQAGMAPVTRRWLAVEHRGAWTREAAETNPVIARLAARARGVDARLALIRAPGRRRDDPRLQVFLADTTPGHTRLISVRCTPDELAELDPATLTGTEVTEPVLLVCAHSRRDRCCAIDGRALAGQLVGQVPHLWECSHLRGHRFAPTAVVLPIGYVYGRLDAGAALAAVKAAAAGEVEITSCSGRSTWPAAGQVAELALREHLGERDAAALVVDAFSDDAVILRHADGRAWSVGIESRRLDTPRAVSCGKLDEPVDYFAATSILPVPGRA